MRIDFGIKTSRWQILTHNIIHDKEMNKEQCVECSSENTSEYMDPIEKSDGMHYYFLCEDCKHEWEIIRK